MSTSPTSSLFSLMHPGALVSIATPGGRIMKGRCVMKFPTHAVLNIGGRHGTPTIADDSNVCAVSFPKKHISKD